MHTFGIVWSDSNLLGPRAIREALPRSAATVKRLSWFTSVLLTITQCSEIASQFRRVEDLSLGVARLDTSYALSGDLRDYANALSQLRNLTHLTVNAGDVQESLFVTMPARRESILLWRINFALTMVQACHRLTSITFLPFSLHKDTISIRRDVANGRVSRLDFVERVGTPLWWVK